MRCLERWGYQTTVVPEWQTWFRCVREKTLAEGRIEGRDEGVPMWRKVLAIYGGETTGLKAQVK